MEKLTVELAIEKVKRIDHLKDDDESAHSAEDELNDWFIECVAKGMYDSLDEAILVAKEVIKSADISFSRWCA